MWGALNPRTLAPLENVDPYASNVKSLLRFYGANGSGTVTDDAGISWSVGNGSNISTEFGPFLGQMGGGGSFVCGNSNTPLSTTSAALSLGAGDYTIECFIAQAPSSNASASTNSYGCIFENRSSSNVGIGIYSRSITSGGPGFGLSNNSQQIVLSSNSAGNVGISQDGVTQLGWTHFAVQRAANQIYMFVNGIYFGGAQDTRTYSATPTTIWGNAYVYNQEAYAYLAQCRITVGVARYAVPSLLTQSFPVPVAPYPPI